MTNYYIKVSVLNKHAGTHWLGCICRHSHDQNHKTGQMRWSTLNVSLVDENSLHPPVRPRSSLVGTSAEFKVRTKKLLLSSWWDLEVLCFFLHAEVKIKQHGNYKVLYTVDEGLRGWNVLQLAVLIDWFCYILAQQDQLASYHNIAHNESLRYHYRMKHCSGRFQLHSWTFDNWQSRTSLNVFSNTDPSNHWWMNSDTHYHTHIYQCVAVTCNWSVHIGPTAVEHPNSLLHAM